MLTTVQLCGVHDMHSGGVRFAQSTERLQLQVSEGASGTKTPDTVARGRIPGRPRLSLRLCCSSPGHASNQFGGSIQPSSSLRTAPGISMPSTSRIASNIFVENGQPLSIFVVANGIRGRPKLFRDLQVRGIQFSTSTMKG